MSARPTYRVAIVAACPFPSLRGSQVLVREMAESLAQAGHAVHVVTYPTAQHLTPVQRIAIHRVAKLPGLWTARPFGWQKLVLDILLAWLLWQTVRRERIDVIHAHNLEAPLIAYAVRWLTGVPVIYHAHNALADELPCYFGSAALRYVARRVGALCDRMLAGAADHTVALSDRLAAYLAARGAAGRITAIAPSAARVAAGEPPARRDRAPVIMYGGNLDPYQHLECLLRGFARLRALEPQARLVVVTHPVADAKGMARAVAFGQQPGVSVRVLNSFAAAMRVLGGADVLVCPRASWSGFPIKALNYMALGRPIVHARSSAHAVEDGVTGLLYDDGDVGALAKALLRIVRDAALAAQLGRQARAIAREHYGAARALARLQSVYERVIEREGAGRPRPRDTTREVEYAMRAKHNTMEVRRSSVRQARRGLTLLTGTLLMATLAGCAAKPTQAPLPPVAEPLSPSLVDTGQYRLEAGDVLRVKFIYQPEMDVKVQIDPDGNISIPGVGEVQATGKTAAELATDIQTLSSANLRNPEVTVIVAELGPRKVYVGGEVRLPGPVVYRVGMTPMQAILDRGGFTEVARIDSVLHVTSKGNNVEATRLDFSGEVIKGSPELTTLAVNDVIYVPRTFIGDADAFVRLYIRGLMPTTPRFGIGFSNP
jgi:protein involved in polysaccharide export with SLBB domain/glycosyltransferase involved in cell wall biosynthesis